MAMLLLAPSLSYAQSQETQQVAPQKKAGFALYPTNPTVVDYNNIILELKPGQTVNESLTLENMEELEETFTLYPADYTTDENGTKYFKQKNDQQDQVGHWTVLDQEEITLKPGEKKTLTISITIPEGTELGDYKGGVAMENLQPSITYPGIMISRRFVMSVKVKVTNEPQTLARAVQANIFNSTTPYFWISIGIFAASMAYFIYAKKSEKNAKLKESQKE
ncbi:DUF916 domain-containing protein [Candidatus Peregrinibacteria bacterium]|nr:DUF916 domain-containing protein [Candidatus Peregrinibacteria bacterium]